ncbi:MAG: PepSY-associated TM helix domain-containing protein, partial [Pseudomonadota bacterium]
FTFQYFFRNLHRYLFLPKAIGLTIVSSMAVILAISLYTGLKTSRNWRTLMTRIRVAKGVRIAIGDAHKFAGLWSIWFFVLMISTGLWYYAEFLGKDFEPRRPTLSEDMTQQMGDLVAFPAVTDIVRAAQRAYPELKISAVSYPDITRSPIMVDGKVGNPIVRLRANRVFLNPATLEVIKIHRDKDFGLVQWLNQIADPLHFGNFGGLAVKLIWFTFGLFLTGLSASGVWLTWQRLKSRGATKVQIALFPILLVSAFSGIGNYLFLSVPMGTIEPSVGAIWYIVAVMLGLFAPVVAVKLLLHMRSRSATRLKTAATGGCLLIMTGGFTHAVFIQQPLAPAQERAFDDVTDGPVSATLFAETAENSMLSGDIRITARSGDARHILHLKSVSMRLENQDGVIGKAVTKTINGALVTQNIRFKDTPIMDAERLRVTFELQSGKTYTAIWRVDRQLF